jgi:hypothetical protein
MLRKQEVEKTLKHFLKKKVSFVAGLVVSFLITGGIGLASSIQIEAERNLTREGLLSKIEVQKTEVQALLEENEAQLRYLQSNYENLVRQGDYYSKPVYPSSQIFFRTFYENAGKMKDRTTSAFSKELSLMSEYLSKYVSGSVSGLTPELEKAYLSGTLSAGDLAELLLKSGNGAVSVGNPHKIEIDLGVNVKLLEPQIPVVSKNVDVKVDVPSAPTISITAPIPNIPTFSSPTITIPTLSPVTTPTVSLQVIPPEEVTPIIVGSVSPSAPGGVSLIAPTVNVSVTPPIINPSMARPPVVPNSPAALSFNVTPTGPGEFTTPATPTQVTAPTAPASPAIVLFNPASINFNGSGFIQNNGASVQRTDVVIRNFDEYNTTDTVYIMASPLAISINWTYWSGGTVNATIGGVPATLAPGTGYARMIAFISDADDHDVIINGDYDMTVDQSRGDTAMFLSDNPFYAGRYRNVDHVVEFTGNLTLHSANIVGGDTTCILGLEHQLHANWGGPYAGVNSGLLTTILKNTGIIDLNSGYNLVGFQIDTEYMGGGGIASGFRKKPQTINDGLIKISAGATNSIAVDYGYYYAGSPNSKVWLGNIEIYGNKSYGFRMKSYPAAPAYYNLIEVTGNNSFGSGNILINGSENVGIAMFQGPTDNLAQASGTYAIDPTGVAKVYTDPSDVLYDLNVTVNGDQNVGFYRSFINNTNAMYLTDTKIENIDFGATSTGGALIRADAGEIIVDFSMALSAGGITNSALQAGGTGIVTLATSRTITASLPTFYGMTAGNFSGSTGATANNHGALTLSGANSIGLAVANGNFGTTDGNITVSGADATGIYNLGSTTTSGGTITASGLSSTGIYHNAGATTTLLNTDIVANATKATGIYNTSTGITLTGGSVSATGTTGVGNVATGIFNSGTLSTSGVTITANNDGVGIYNSGTMTVSTGSITASGARATGVYSKTGTIDLNGIITASGANATGVVYEAGTMNETGFDIAATGSQSLGLYNLGTLATTPDISMGSSNATGIYNAAGSTLTSTGDIDTFGTAYTHIAGIYNVGTLTNTTSNITIDNGSSTGIYNNGVITTIGGNIAVSGIVSGISIGIYNAAGKTIGNAAGILNAGNNATAIYNAGTMTVSGSVIASGTAQSTGIYNTLGGDLTLGGAINIGVTGADGTGIYNDSTNNMLFTAGQVSASGTTSAGIYHIGAGTFTFGGIAVISTTGESDAGIFNVEPATAPYGDFLMNGGTVTVVGANSQGSVGIYNKGIHSEFAISGGTVTALNEQSTGIYNEGTFNMSGGNIIATGKSTTGMYNNGTFAIFNVGGGIITTTGEKSSTIYDRLGIVNFNSNITVVAGDGATGIYVTGGTINTGLGVETTINVTNTLLDTDPGYGEGVAVFASDNGTIGSDVDLTGAKITVVDGSSAIASYGVDPGAGITNLNLTNAVLDYNGDGFAVYSNGDYGKINLTGAHLHLRGDATGVEMDYTGATSITFNGTTIDIWNQNVTVANIKNYTIPLEVDDLSGGIAGALGPGVTLVDHTGGLYTYARIDGGVLSINANINKLDTTGPGGEDYYKRFQGQRMKITVESGKTVTAVMSTAQATLDYNNQVIALESNSSFNAVSPLETEIKLLNGAKIIAARTDTGGFGAVGAFINYGNVSIINGATIEVQQGYNTVTEGVGVFAINGSIVNNAGTIKVAGGNGIGILSMGYRYSSMGVNDIGAEFGASAPDQGKITVNNTGNITLDNNASIGIYAQNNTSSASGLYVAVRLPGDDSVQNTGNITVSSGNSPTDMSIGIYGSGVTIKNSGNITVGDYGVGIYGIDGSTIDTATTGTLGTIKIGGNSVGIMGNGATIAATVTSLNLQSDNTTQDKIGIMYNGTASNINFNIDGTNFKKGTIIYLKDPGTAFTYGSVGKTIKVGSNGVGLYLSESITPGTITATNAGTIDLLSGATKAVGIYVDGGTAKNNNVININDSSGQVGIFASGATAKADNAGGTINLLANNGTGIYLENGAVLTNSGTVNFGTATGGIGVLLDGSIAAVGGLSISSDNVKQNILIYAQDKSGTASTVTNGTTLTVNGQVLPPSGSNKTIGVYLKKNTVQNIYTGGVLAAINGALGVYSRGDNKISNATVESTGKGTVGIYLDGPSELDTDIVKSKGANAGESVIGIYANGGVVTVTGSLDIETGTLLGSDYATGMYLTNGATVTGTVIDIVNNSLQTNVGLYYSSVGTVVQGTNITLNGTGLVGLYADGGITLNNANAITYTVGASKLIGAYVSGNSNYISTSTGDIIGTTGSAGILAGEGTGTNRGILTVNNNGSAAMAALAKLTTETAKAVNDTGALINSNAGAGMLIGAMTGYLGNSIGENKGTITAVAGAVGVAINGTKGKFDGTGGNIAVNGSSAVGLYLEETGINQVLALGTLSLGTNDSIGIYANKSKLDFNVILGSAITTGIGVLAKGTATKKTEITSIIDASNSTNTIGVFLDDNNVIFNNATIKAGNVGLYIKAMATNTLENVTVESKSSGAVGIYTQATNLIYKATTTVENGGLGIYVPVGATLTTDGGIINIDGASSVGIVLDGGTGNIGTTGNLIFNFGSSHGMGILVRNGGTLNIGAMLTMTGAGALAAVENSSLSNSGTFTVIASTALLGNFTSGGPYVLENAAAGVINVTGGGVGIAALSTAGTATVTARNNGIINVSGKDGSNNSSVGIYTTIADIQNNNVINVGADGIGIYADGTNRGVINNSIVLNGSKAIGIIVGGATSGLTSTNITGSNGTVGMYLDGLTGGNINAGTIILADDTVGIYANGGTATVRGNITIGNKTTASPIGIFATNSANITIGSGTTITTGQSAIAIGADNSTISGVDATIITATAGGIQLYVGNGGSIGVVGAGTLDADDSVGIMINGTGTITGVTNIDVRNGGVGAYFINSTASIPVINIYDGKPGIIPEYSIGVYYSGMSGTLTLPAINQIGDYTIGAGIDRGSTLSLGNISMISTTATNQIGIISKGTAVMPNDITMGTVVVNGSDQNIGFYGEYTDVSSGNIIVGDSNASSDKSTASIGIYISNGGITTGTITTGKYSIGLYADDLNAIGMTTQGITVDEGGMGIHGIGSGIEDISITGNLSIGRNEAIGIYGKDVRIDVTGSITIGEGTSVGIVSEGAGDVIHTGTLAIADKGASTGSIGIYKKGKSGNITTSASNWSVGDSGYGLYLIEDSGDGTGHLTATNNADMILGESSVGIYGKGNMDLVNTGNITVGSTYLGPNNDHGETDEHKNSAGIYLASGAKLTNTATITVEEDHSVGVYVLGENSYFENAFGAVIDVDSGGTGILVKRDSTKPAELIGGTALNNGIINIGNNPSVCGNYSFGMAAYGGSTIINGTTGVINVYDGVAMYVGSGGYLDNQGTINIYTGAGTGIMGNGSLINEGNINIIGGAGTTTNTGASGPIEEGSIKIDEHGIIINKNYVSVGGTLKADLPIVLNGPYVDITNFGDATVPLFSAPNIMGTIHLTPNFATIGNGYAFKVDNFTKALESGGESQIIVETSPMFIIKEVSGSLYVAKKPYVELLAPGIMDLKRESQYKNLYDGLDNLLYADPKGTSRDSIMLKDLNAHLEEVFIERGVQEFNKEAARTLSETRGDIYGTIQTRMKNVQQAFDGAFEELLGSYNTSKDSDKYSVIYGQGKFADDTLGVDGYDYRVQGLVYMKEYEGRNYGNKWGYSIGFGVSRFDFDDAPTYHDKSKEDVYSIRAGIHGVLNFNNEDTFRLISRLELGYNRHEAERTLELEKTHKNKGEYDSYQVSFDNRLEKTIYRSTSSKVDIYAGINLEYGVMKGFSESGDGLEVKVEGNDYFSIQPEIGIKGYKRAYIGKKLSLKLEGSMSYGHEFGNFYDENEAKIRYGGTENYELIRPEKERGVAKGKIGLTIEKANKMGVTIDVEAKKYNNKEKTDLRYGITMKYVF